MYPKNINCTAERRDDDPAVADAEYSCQLPKRFIAPKYVPPRFCGDANGDRVPDERAGGLFNCTSAAILEAGLTADDPETWAVLSPRLKTPCAKGEQCTPQLCCVDLGPACTTGMASSAWELGDGGGPGAVEVRLASNYATAEECRDAVYDANVLHSAGQTANIALWVYPTDPTFNAAW